MLEQGYAIFTDCFVVVLNNSYDYRSSQNIDRTKLDIKKNRHQYSIIEQKKTSVVKLFFLYHC